MNARERLLAVAVVSLVILAGLGVVFYEFYLSPYHTRQTNLERLRKEGETKSARVNEIAAQRPQLERYRQQSLPADVNVARIEYGRYLDDLLRKSNFTQVSITPRPPNTRSAPTLANKVPIYTQLDYAVQGRATSDNLVKMLESFYRTGLMHHIKVIDVRRPVALQQGQRPDELDVTFTVDALVVHGADKRPTLMPILDRRLAMADTTAALRGGPAGFGALLALAVGPFGPHGPGVLAEPERDYSAMSAKNIFFGPPPERIVQRTDTEVEALRHTILTDITTDYGRSGRREASVYDQSTNQRTRLRTLGGFNQFALVRNNQGSTLVHGEVVRIDDRGLVFRVGLNAREPEEKGPNYYRDREEIYTLHKDDIDALAREGAIRTDDASRVFWVDKGRWDSLIADKMVSVNGRAFAFRWDLVKGFVVRDDGKSVILRIDDKYCGYRYDQGGRPTRQHEGYCTLHIGGNVADALGTPLKEGEIKTLAAH